MKQYFEKQLDCLVSADVQNALDHCSISEESLKHYPPSLYKYRSCSNEYSFSVIEEGYLWADLPNNFDDPVDSLINYKLISELPTIQKWIYQHLGEILYYHLPPQGMCPCKNGQSLQAYMEAQEKFIDSAGRYNAKKARKIMLIETRKMHPTQQQKINKIYERMESPEFEQVIIDNLKKVVNILRERSRVCCLTQRKDNQKMWEDYADQYTGFVIEYDISRTIGDKDLTDVLRCTFPVDYYKRLPKVPMLPFIQSEFYRKLYDQEVDISGPLKKMYKQLLVKKEEYSGEEEWRIISSTHKIKFPIISAVYMGYKIKEQDEQHLRRVCAQKNIPLYKQEFHPFTGKMHFPLLQGEETVV